MYLTKKEPKLRLNPDRSYDMNRHRHPEIYMKRRYNKNYFEGWYYKHVDASRKHTISFIPSVSYSGGSNFAYIQVIYQSESEVLTDVMKLDISSFKALSKPFMVEIDDNRFSYEGIDINFVGENISVHGQLSYSDVTKLDYSVFNPNIMGIFSYIPFMQCNHGVLSMNHLLSGTLTIGDRDISFDGGRGYIEKDWGSSFPKDYIWIQCNHFNTQDTSLFFSYAHIPFLFKDFQGFICNFLFDGKQYRFATYTGAKVLVHADSDRVNISVGDGKHLLMIYAKTENSRELYAPVKGEMTDVIKESLRAYVRVKLIDVRKNTVVYESDSNEASMEFVL